MTTSPDGKMSLLVVAICVASCSHLAFGATLVDQFDAYIQKYGRQYARGSSEYVQRRTLFERRAAQVEAQNGLSMGRWRAVTGVFADRTDAERSAVRGWSRRQDSATHGGQMRPGFASGASLLALDEVQPKTRPTSADWRFLKVASQIIDQSDCGSCWAATTSAVLEAHYEIHHGVPKTFSTQEIVSCTPNPKQCGGQGGCEGATAELGMQWVLENGLKDDSEMPYESRDMDCPRTGLEEFKDATGRAFKQKGRAMGMVGWQTLMPKNKAEPLMKAVLEWGPVAISVSADTWHEYSHGIFDGCQKDVVVDHAVTLYGYGEEDKAKYWLIRNTWGPDWGESGFIRMHRHDQGEEYCGLDHDNLEGVGCKGDPSTVQVCGMCGMFADSVVPHFAGAMNLTRADVHVPDWLRGSHAAALAERQSIGTAGGADAAPRIVRREEATPHEGIGRGHRVLAK